VLVAFVTAEEKGLVGSDYLARHPPAGTRIVAAVNLDMPVLQWPLTDVVAFGAGSSSLGGLVKRALDPLGLGLTPDPMPEQNLFVRSDQYSMVKQGIPSLYLVPGFASADPAVSGRELFDRFLSTHYHQPSDELALPIDMGAV